MLEWVQINFFLPHDMLYFSFSNITAVLTSYPQELVPLVWNVYAGIGACKSVSIRVWGRNRIKCPSVPQNALSLKHYKATH